MQSSDHRDARARGAQGLDCRLLLSFPFHRVRPRVVAFEVRDDISHDATRHHTRQTKHFADMVNVSLGSLMAIQPSISTNA